MARNTLRFDLSDYLIHFFRQVEADGSASPPMPEHLGFANISEDTSYRPIFMLRCAVRHHKLWATWSLRNNVRTIYGPDPAVCFTEMPLAAFLEAGAVRAARGEAMSQFALVFPKNGLFSVGANPAIYGLDARDLRVPAGRDGSLRIIKPDFLPEREQYRFVVYNPISDKPIDWSHEREWRWPFRGDRSGMEEELQTYGIVGDASDVVGLDLSNPSLSGMGVVVQNEIQAKRVSYDILSLVDLGVIDKNHYAFILCTDGLGNLEDLRSPSAVSHAIRAAMIDFSPFFSRNKKREGQLIATFSKMVDETEKEYPNISTGAPGPTWLWVLDNTHDLTRALLSNGFIEVTTDRRYLVKLPQLNPRRGQNQRQEMIRDLAIKVEKHFGIECGYYSSFYTNPNIVPFFCSDHLNNEMFNNWAQLPAE